MNKYFYELSKCFFFYSLNLLLLLNRFLGLWIRVQNTSPNECLNDFILIEHIA